MGTPADILSGATLYLKIYASGLVFNVLYNMLTGILNAAGNSKRPLYYLAAASITNIILDLLFIAIFHFGVEGAAIATVISQALSCILALRYLLTVDDSYRISIKKIKITKQLAKNIITIGLPAGIQNMVISFSNVLVQSAVNSFGSASVAGFASYMKIDGFNILPITSFSLAITTFTGQNCGAGKVERVKRGTLITLAMGVVYCAAIGIILLLFAYPLMRMFTSDEEVINVGILAMKYFCPFYTLLAVLNIMAGTIRGAGKSLPPMIILLTAMCLFRIVWLHFFTPLFSDISGVFIIYPISWVLGVVMMLLYAWKGKWLPKSR